MIKGMAYLKCHTLVECNDFVIIFHVATYPACRVSFDLPRKIGKIEGDSASRVVAT